MAGMIECEHLAASVGDRHYLGENAERISLNLILRPFPPGGPTECTWQDYDVVVCRICYDSIIGRVLRELRE